MKKHNLSNTLLRRKFLQTTSALALAALLMGLGSTSISYAEDVATPILAPTLKLNNKVSMPAVGFGTFTLKGAAGEQAVADAISVGYRLIDTATIYGNEKAVGNGIKKSGIDRKELFIISKVWISDLGYEKTKKAFERTLANLGTEYLDMYLIHRHRPGAIDSWRAMEELYKAGKIKSIGVSNFSPEQLKELMDSSTVTPALNQIENHIFFQQEDTHQHLKKLGIRTQAWSQYAQGRNNFFTNETLTAIGKKHGKTAAQVSQRWLYQRGIVTIPRTSKKKRMIENINIFDFKLTDAEMKQISKLDLNRTMFPEWK